MKFLKQIEQWASSLTKKEFQRYFVIYLIGVTLLAALLIFWQNNKSKNLRKKILITNTQRISAQAILSQDASVKKQKNIVDQTLKERKSFKLQLFFELIINKLKLQNNLKKSVPFVSTLESLRSAGYSEVRVEASLINLNTKQLVELLDEIEKNPIIYVKYLEIIKSGKAPIIDVIITIATLQIDKDKVVG